MIKRVLLVVFPVSVMSLFLFSFAGKQKLMELPAPGQKATIKTLIIDPGHGGFDPGARGLVSNEADVSLAVGLKLGRTLKEEFPDLNIIYTRSTDIGAGNKKNKQDDLYYRANLANESNGDLFISIHCNSSGKKAGGWYEKVVTGKTPVKKTVGKGKKKRTVTSYKYTYETRYRENEAHGTETYIWALSKNDAKVNSLSKIEYYGEIDSTGAMDLHLPNPSDPAEKARMLIYAQQFFRKSLNLADLVEKEFAASGRVSRGVKQRNDTGIWVLQATGMPSILVEIGFITNKNEEEYINSDKGQKEIVDNLVSAFRTYKQKVESRTITTTP
ncbi:MAG: N-acetylmuramoyl-L-alanine amidase [Chitinophagaceae bacterium]